MVFLPFFFILDQGYGECKEDDLGGFLGAISPELWGDGKPIDRAILHEWNSFCGKEMICEYNLVKKVYDFLELYEKFYGYDFSKIKQWLISKANEAVVRKAFEKSRIMQQKYQYE